MKPEVVARTFREMCGDYFPAETEEAKRFVLTVPDGYGTDDDIRVPVFIRREEKAQYPEIRISPFITSPEEYYGFKHTYSPGVAPYENTDINYKRTRVDAKIVRTTFQVDIYATDEVDLYRIRDTLKDRIHKFNYVETAKFVESEGWEQDGNIYVNSDYNTDIVELYKVYEDGTRLTKSTTLDTAGTWNLTDDGLYVYPYDDINNVEYWEVTNGGLVLSDGNSIRSKGIFNVKTSLSKALEEVDPLIIRWIFQFKVDYLSTTTMDVGRTFKEVNVDATERQEEG